MKRSLSWLVLAAIVLLVGVAIAAPIIIPPQDDPDYAGSPGTVAVEATAASNAINVLGARQVALTVSATNAVLCSVFTWQVSNDSTNWTAAASYANQLLTKSDSLVDARFDLGGRTSSLIPAANVPYIPYNWARVVVTPYYANGVAMTGLRFRAAVLRDVEHWNEDHYR